MYVVVCHSLRATRGRRTTGRASSCGVDPLLLGHHGREYVQRPVGAALDPKYTLKTERLEQGQECHFGDASAPGD